MNDSESPFDKVRKTREYQADEDNKNYVDDLEKQFEKIQRDKAFMDQDYVKEIARKIRSILASINIRLVEEDEPIARMKMKCDREAYEKFLSWFSKETEKEMAMILDRVEEILDSA